MTTTRMPPSRSASTTLSIARSMNELLGIQRTNADITGERRLEIGNRLRDGVGHRARVGPGLLVDRQHHGRTAGPAAVVALARTPRCRRASPGHRPRPGRSGPGRPAGRPGSSPPCFRDLRAVRSGPAPAPAVRSAPADRGSRPWRFRCFEQGLLDLGQRHAVAQQRIGIDQHLELLAAAPHREDLGHAGNRSAAAAARPSRPASAARWGRSRRRRSTCRASGSAP